MILFSWVTFKVPWSKELACLQFPSLLSCAIACFLTLLWYYLWSQLILQLKEVVDILPAGQNALSKSSLIAKHTSNLEHLFSSNSMMSPRSEVNCNSDKLSISHGSKGLTEKSETVIQDEPGVYLTLLALPNGSNELKRVRFRYVFIIILALNSNTVEFITESSSITSPQFAFHICWFSSTL